MSTELALVLIKKKKRRKKQTTKQKQQPQKGFQRAGTDIVSEYRNM